MGIQPAVGQWQTVAVVMPAYNEHVGLADFVTEIRTHLIDHCENVHFVIVDDCSVGPLEPVVAHIRSIPSTEVVVVRNERNLGHGPSVVRAYRRGLAVSPDAVIHVDGDGQFSGSAFPLLLTQLTHADVVMGLRVGRNDPWFRRLITRSLRVGISHPSLRDVNTPLRAYRPRALRQLLESVPDDSLIPHIRLTHLLATWDGRISSESVEHRAGRGACPQGTTWGPRNRRIVPSAALVKFCFRAGLELWTSATRPPVRVAPNPTALAEG